jgi:short-subunit dehydrogenase
MNMTSVAATPGRLAGGKLAGRIALVTGASRGIGAAIARAYAKEGADLILTARTTGGLEELDDEIRGINGKTSLLVPFDLKDFDAIDRLGAALYERFGRLDVLVGNASTSISPPIGACSGRWIPCCANPRRAARSS